MIVGLVSTWREGQLAASAVRSLLACCDAVRVMEGPIGEQPPSAGIATDWAPFAKDQRVIVHEGTFATDAEKRTALLDKTRRYPAPTWGVILDGDELLLWGEYLREQIEHMQARYTATGATSTGCSMRIVESDGSVGQINARVLRLDLVERYVHSSYHLRFTNGTESARPNFVLRLAGQSDLPPHADLLENLDAFANGSSPEGLRATLEHELAHGYIQRRRPLHGEPHILHRSVLRAQSRDAVPRMHLVESEGLVAAGSLAVPVETGEGVRIWTP